MTYDRPSDTRRVSVLVTRRLPGDAVRRLEQTVAVDLWEGDDAIPRSELLARVHGVAAIVSTINERVDTEVLDAAGPALRVVSNVAVGYDNIDIAACNDRGIVVGHTPGVLTETTAELTIALIFATSRRLLEAADAARSGAWTSWGPTWMCGHDLKGATLGLVGFGAIGQAVARRAHALEMHVIHHDPARESMSLDELLEIADVVSLHCPLTPATRALIGAPQLARMKRSAILINTARGPLVDQDALVSALRSGEIWAAGLDVTMVEPIPVDDPLLELSNCIVLPHIGSASVATRAAMASLAIDNAVAALGGHRPRHAVNTDAVQPGPGPA